MSAGKTYQHEMYQRFAYLATWLPNTKLKLGDVGVLRGEEFRQMTTLKELGVPFIVRRGEAQLDFNYTSASGVMLQTKAKGKAAAGTTLPAAKAGIAAKFSKQGAFVFQAVGSRVHEIENKVTVGQAVIRLYEQGRWEAAQGHGASRHGGRWACEAHETSCGVQRHGQCSVERGVGVPRGCG